MANPKKVDPEARAFLEDPDLQRFLGSPEARLTHQVLIDPISPDIHGREMHQDIAFAPG